MASYNLNSDCSPLFTSTNYFWWQEIMEHYAKHKSPDLWEIIKNGPIIIEKSNDKLPMMIRRLLTHPYVM